MQLRAQLRFGLLENRQWVTTIFMNELRKRQLELVDFVHMSEQQATAVFFGLCRLSSALCNALECSLINTATLLNRQASSTRACLVGSKQGRNQ